MAPTPPPPPPQQQQQQQQQLDLGLFVETADLPPFDKSAASILSSPSPPWPSKPAASSSSSSASQASGDDLLAAEDTDGDLECVTVAGDDYSVCSMKTVTVSSLLTPSPGYLAVLLLCPPVLGFLVFMFVQYFVPVLVQILMEM